MEENINSVFHGLNSAIGGGLGVSPEYITNTGTDTVLYTTNDRTDYEKKLLQYRQQKYLSWSWQKAGNDVAMESLAGYTAVKLMYRDADLMCGMPEIGAALEIISEEACCLKDGRMLNIYSKSPRIKAILEDLFENRLNIHTQLPMVCYAMIKYGNQFMLLNVDKNNGVLGWKQLPVYEIDRWENGHATSSAIGATPMQTNEIKQEKIQFVWVGHNESNPYSNFQVAHFRLLNDSFFLPYGVSALHKARRSWRMWSMMEDAMLIYRLDRSIERRVFKVYVGAIDEQDVPAFVQDVANNFKRTPVIDPLTGQVDLRKNFLDVSSDYFIPVRDPSAPSPIESLPAAQNATAMDDIQYMQNKVFAALRVPKSFLNFQEAQGKGQNLSLLDIRFCRMVNRIQQFLLMELNKIAMVHLWFLGFRDELTNFTLSLNNPSAQIEALELEDLTKRLQTAAAALADPGIGMPIVSLHWTLKNVMKFTDSEIADMLGEIRVEKAMAAELAQTAAIIKKTGLFDKVDRIYGDYDAMAAMEQGGGAQMQQQDPNAAGGGGGDMTGGFDGGAMSADSLGSGAADLSGGSGAEGTTDMASAPAADAGAAPIMESVRKKQKVEEAKSFTERYFERLNELKDNEQGALKEAPDIFEVKTVTLNEEINRLFTKIDALVGDEEEDDDEDETEENENDDIITEEIITDEE